MHIFDSMKVANPFLRLIAVLIDQYVIQIFLLLLWNFNLFTIEPNPLTAFWLLILYASIMEYYFGATLGKLILNLRVIKEDGSKLDFKTSMLRNLWKIVAAIPIYQGLLRMLSPSFPQGVHDAYAKCYVVNKG